MISVIAHRGASADRPENTVEAFAEAVRQGADGVELDLRRGPGGELVVLHDPLAPGLAVAPSVPSLAAALDACRGLVVNVEVKNLPHEPDWDPEETLAADLVGLLRARGGVDRVVVSSFAVATVDAVRAADPTVPTGLLTLAAFDQAAALALVVERGHAALHPHHQALTPELVAAAHEAGVAVTTWTVDDPDRLRAVAALGADAVITNRPAFARAALSASQNGTVTPRWLNAMTWKTFGLSQSSSMQSCPGRSVEHSGCGWKRASLGANGCPCLPGWFGWSVRRAPTVRTSWLRCWMPATSPLPHIAPRLRSGG